MDLMIILFLLVLINLLIAIARTSSKKWLRVSLNSVSFVLLFVSLLFVLRMFL
ncbi:MULTISPECIES: hypothetical protein [Thermoactinomyces]|uniref:Uncharacterized protein n=1 Tax=Thermoactinomyces daqus TaxID=1329516 RepID=A0A7W1XAS4_9BACL|nr:MULTISPECIES: hypothetical protein [Thermoactinomyces]MBA4543128.1 hypothetical protein [Thermoactinomyces daqus]MBH8596637.1 hypothetical protein [Thermoactinomyces sp. CICC 10523]MBH8603399.1 hypothetical protein [Thermoactinomyces sp. CICC 10522]MBH8607834.1 hypothetical protein [Thermoactinomyces sp. CICC 10521]